MYLLEGKQESLSLAGLQGENSSNGKKRMVPQIRSKTNTIGMKVNLRSAFSYYF